MRYAVQAMATAGIAGSTTPEKPESQKTVLQVMAMWVGEGERAGERELDG
tara:strand:- start:694 stop:843 length:150 start_codon:yes stop_codon:yes gene_type:complete